MSGPVQDGVGAAREVGVREGFADALLSAEPIPVGPDRRAGRPTVVAGIRADPVALVVTTMSWLSTARIALALFEAGFTVRAACPRGHPLTRLDFVDGIFSKPALNVAQGLRRAILDSGADLVVAADEPAVDGLIALYAATTGEDPACERVRAVIARSLGRPESFEILHRRRAISELAAAWGVRGPATATVAHAADPGLSRPDGGFPVVLKTDGSWGGVGTVIAPDAEAAGLAFRRLVARPSLLRGIKRLLINGDVGGLRASLRRRRPVVNVQPYIAGPPANAAVACWRGQVLSMVCVEAIRTTAETGPSTVVRVIRHPAMEKAVEQIIRALGLSGLCGVDFILNGDSAWMLEVNPRATPTCHLPGDGGVDLAKALRAALEGVEPPRGEPSRPGEEIALFPQELIRDPNSPHLKSARHDIPHQAPELVRLGYAWSARRGARS